MISVENRIVASPLPACRNMDSGQRVQAQLSCVTDDDGISPMNLPRFFFFSMIIDADAVRRKERDEGGWWPRCLQKSHKPTDSAIISLSRHFVSLSKSHHTKL